MMKKIKIKMAPSNTTDKSKLSRRGFLKALAAIATIPLITPAFSISTPLSAPLKTIDLEPSHWTLSDGDENVLAALTDIRLDVDNDREYATTGMLELAPPNTRRSELEATGYVSEDSYKLLMDCATRTMTNPRTTDRRFTLTGDNLVINVDGFMSSLSMELLPPKKPDLVPGDHVDAYGRLRNEAGFLKLPETEPICARINFVVDSFSFQEN